MTSFDHDSLWLKAKLFLNRAMDDDVRSFDERALWAALALELLAKAALARVSPLLIAEPNEEGTNLLIASGLVSGEARFTSIRAKTLMSRCHKAFKPFDSSEAMKIVNGRNEYLHGAGVGFMSVPPEVWWPRYWAQAAILVTALDRDIDELVGTERELLVSRYLEENAKNLEHLTQALIERAKQRLVQRREGHLPARLAAEWKTQSQLSASMRYSELSECPACGSEGLLEGEDVIDTEVIYPSSYQYEEFSSPLDASVKLTVGADHFSCPICQLVLNRYELVEQAGLPTDFEAEGDIDDLAHEPDYGND